MIANPHFALRRLQGIFCKVYRVHEEYCRFSNIRGGGGLQILKKKNNYVPGAFVVIMATELRCGKFVKETWNIVGTFITYSPGNGPSSSHCNSLGFFVVPTFDVFKNKNIPRCCTRILADEVL